MKKRQIVFLIVLVLCTLWIVGTALAQAPTLSGGNYRLVGSLNAEKLPTPANLLQGGAYRLQPDAPAVPTAVSNGGCCCTFLPCVKK